MEKKRSWFTCVKRLFTPPNSKPESQEKSKNWRLFVKKLRSRQQYYYPAIKEQPPPPPPPQRTLNEAAEEQRKQAVAVAVATAAAAEAAVAAANAAVEVVWLTNVPYEAERNKKLHLAAIKIQTAYRGHLSRKALSALKGTVKLQAVVRGELVRKNVVENAQPLLVHRTRVPSLLDYLSHADKRHSFVLNEGIESEEFELHCNTHRSLDLSSVSKEAITKRECMRQYSFSHRERRDDKSLQEPITLKQNRTSIRSDQRAELEVQRREETEKLIKPMSRSNSVAADTTTRLAQLKLKTTRKHETAEDLNSRFSQPRRSFCNAKQKSIGDHQYGSLPSSPIFPAYMAATEATKAKSRSFSTPRQRLRLCETYSGPHSLYKLGLSSCGSFNGEIITKNQKRE